MSEGKTDTANTSTKNQEFINNKTEVPENFDLINLSNKYMEFKTPEYDIKWEHIFEKTYYFKQDIGRVWFFIKNFSYLSFISNEGHFPCVNIKGKDTWNVGNIFKGNVHKKFPFVAKVEKNIDFPEMKMIKWLFYNIKDNYYFNAKLNLYKNTEDNSTILLKKIKVEKLNIINLKEIINTFNSDKIYKCIDDFLDNEPINLLRYESGIIYGKMEDIYNILTDLGKISAIAPNNYIMPNFNLKDLKVGETKEVSILKGKEIQYFNITLRCKETVQGSNKWILVIEVSGGRPKKMPKHTNLFQLTKINNNECQLIILTKYHEPIDNQEFNEYSNKKKYVIMSIKDYFENFFSPEASN